LAGSRCNHDHRKDRAFEAGWIAKFKMRRRHRILATELDPSARRLALALQAFNCRIL
jgi:hypothetical protein